MNLNNIDKGMIVKNYKEMCSLLEVESTTGNAKISQLKEWSRYFDWEKQGNKFVIIEKYIMKLPEDFTNNDVYSKYIQTILTKYLKENGDGQFTMTQLLKLCGFVNEHYSEVDAIDKYIENQDISFTQAKYYLNQLCSRVRTYCHTALIRCLNRLSKRDFLRWHKVLYIQDKDSKDNKFRLATDNEYRKYLKILMNIKKEMNIKYVNLYNKEEYYRKIDNAIAEFGWNKAYELIKILCAEGFADEMVKESEEEYKEALLEVNGHCLNQMYKYVDVDIENDAEKIAKNNIIDIEIARLWTDEEKRKKKQDMVDFFINIKWHELEGTL